MEVTGEKLVGGLFAQMQTMADATQAIIYSIRQNCSVLYFSIKESDYILSELRWRVSSRNIYPQCGFSGKGDYFRESGVKIASHSGAVFTSQLHYKAF